MTPDQTLRADPRRSSWLIGTLVALLAVAALPLHALPAGGEVPSRIGEAPGEKVRQLAPEEMSQRALVYMFFLEVYASLGNAVDHELVLARLGIPIGSDGDHALTEAAHAAMKVLDWPEWPKGIALDSMEAEEFNAAALLRKAHTLADIYVGLLVRLASIDDAAERVAARVESKRYTISSAQIGEQRQAAVASDKAFSARVRERLDERLPGRFEL